MSLKQRCATPLTTKDVVASALRGLQTPLKLRHLCMLRLEFNVLRDLKRVNLGYVNHLLRDILTLLRYTEFSRFEIYFIKFHVAYKKGKKIGMKKTCGYKFESVFKHLMRHLGRIRKAGKASIYCQFFCMRMPTFIFRAMHYEANYKVKIIELKARFEDFIVLLPNFHVNEEMIRKVIVQKIDACLTRARKRNCDQIMEKLKPYLMCDGIAGQVQ